MMHSLLIAVLITVTMVSSVSSQSAKVGDAFTFKTTQTVRDGAITIAAGTLGHGIVSAVSAGAGTHRGSLTLQPQYIQFPDGKRIGVAPATGNATTYNAPRHVFPFPIPVPGLLVVGGVVNSGGNVTIGPGTDFNVVTMDSR